MTPRHRSILSPIAALTLTAALFLPGFSHPPAAGLETTATPEVQTANAAALPVIAKVVPEVDQESIRYSILTGHISSTYSVAPAFAERVVKAAHDIGEKEQVDPVLLLALVGVESSFNPLARSHAGAIGLTQTIPKWHPEKIQAIRRQGKPITDPEANLAMGAKILAEYTAMSRGDRMRGLQRYNGALGDSKQRYANKVMRLYRQFSSIIPAHATGTRFAQKEPTEKRAP